MTKQEPSVQREKKKCVPVLETGKGGAQGATFLENPSEIPSVSQGPLSQPEEGSLRNQLKVTVH